MADVLTKVVLVASGGQGAVGKVVTHYVQEVGEDMLQVEVVAKVKRGEWEGLANAGTRHTFSDCREADGITIGIIDAIINSARLFSVRDLSAPDVVEALADMRQDEDVRKLLGVDDE